MTPAQMAEDIIKHPSSFFKHSNEQLIPLAESHRDLLTTLKKLAAHVALHGTMALRPHDLDAAVKASYVAIDKATGGAA